MKFLENTAAAITCAPDQNERWDWDDELPGFGLRTYPSGKQTWVVRYRVGRKRHRKLNLGDARKLNLKAARKAAKEALACVALGGDPAGAKSKARERITVLELTRAYIEKRGPKLSPDWLTAVRRQLETQAKPLHGEVAETVHRRQIADLLDKISASAGPVAANRLRSTLSAMWMWGLRAGLIDAPANPVAMTLRPGGAETPRDRVLSDDELRLIWTETAGGGAHDRIVRLLMLTGARRTEIAAGQWAEITLDASGTAGLWTLPRNRTKTRLPHEIPLSALAIEQLPKRGDSALIFGGRAKGEKEHPFSGWSASKERLDGRVLKAMRKAAKEAGQDPAAVELQQWGLHDIRRTVSTRLHEAKIAPHIVEDILGHVSGPARRGVAGVYNAASYRTQKRAALLAWEDEVRRIVGLELPPSNLVPMARSA